MTTLLQDIRYGIRMLQKTPILTLIVVITLALGIGANAFMFSLVNGYLLRPLPVPNPRQIAVLAALQKGSSPLASTFSYPDFVDYRDQAEPVSEVFAYRTSLLGLGADGKADQLLVSFVSGNYFSVLGVKPLLGQLIRPEQDQPGGQPVLVLGHSYWQKRFGGDRGVIGKQVRLNGRSATIIGVVPEKFHGLQSTIEMQAYIPQASTASLEDRGDVLMTDRNARPLRVLARLKPGVSFVQAQSSMNVIAERLARQYPETNKDISVQVVREPMARPVPLGNNLVAIIAGLFLVLAGLVLLLACMNVANVMLARATARQREMGLRTALGAGRFRLIRQMLTETLLLGLLGGIAGVVLGAWLNPGNVSSAPGISLPLSLDYSFDWRVFTYAFAAALFTGIFTGLWPALRASRADANVILHEGGRSNTNGRHWARNGLVVAQVAGSLTLLVVAGLCSRSLQKSAGLDLGFDPDHVLNITVDPHQIGYDRTGTVEFYRQIQERARGLAGVQSVSLAYGVPMGTIVQVNGGGVSIEGHPLQPGQQAPLVFFNSIDPGYFQTMRVPLLRGRTFTDFDNEKAPPVAIVNQAMAEKYWPNQDPLGKRFTLKTATDSSAKTLEIVGVCRNGKYIFIAENAQPFFYAPLAQNYVSLRTLQIRSSVPPETLINPVQSEIRKLAPDLPIIEANTMKQTVEGYNGLQVFKLGAGASAGMGLVGLILAVLGVYGVVSFNAAQRTREIGIRMALGGTHRNVLGLVLRQGLWLLIAGVVVGLLAALGISRAMTSVLIGVSPSDPLTYGTVVLLLSTVALLACYIPARRAMRVDPMVALRHE